MCALLQNNEFTMQSLSSSSTMGSPGGSARVSNINIMMDGGHGFHNPTAATFAVDIPK